MEQARDDAGIEARAALAQEMRRTAFLRWFTRGQNGQHHPCGTVGEPPESRRAYFQYFLEGYGLKPADCQNCRSIKQQVDALSNDGGETVYLAGCRKSTESRGSRLPGLIEAV